MRMSRFWIISMTILLSFVSWGFADIIPPNSHPVHRCAMIEDRTDTFPHLVVQSHITGPMIRGAENKNITPNTCLNA